MLDTLHGVGRWLVHDLGWISLETLILTAIVYVVTRWGGIRSSRVKRWLWTIVVLKPVATMLIAWPLPSVVSPGSEMRALVETRAAQVENVPPLATAILPSHVAPRQPSPGPTPPQGETQPPSTTAPVVAQAGEGSVTGFAVLGALWLVGCLALCVYTTAGVVWLLRVRRRALPLTVDDLLAASDEYADAVAQLLERVEVRLTTQIMEPCIYGFFRPVILLPAWCLEEDGPPNLAYILLHEGMHHRAKDHWFLWIRRATEMLLWFHPAVWYAGQKAMAEAENVCDEAVVEMAHQRGTPSAAAMYSSCLMRVLERATRHAFEGLVPGVILTAERIRRLVQQTGPVATSVSRWATFGVVVVGAAALPGAFSGGSALSTQAYHAATDGGPPIREILYASKYPGDYFRNLYIMRSDGTRPMRLTDDRAYYMESDWSPDGSRIVAVSLQPGSGTWRAWIHSADGDPLHLLGEPEWGLDRPAWMPGGVALLAAGQAPTDAHSNIYLVDAAGPILRRVTDDAVKWPVASPSPDGRTIAAIGARAGVAGFELVMMDTNGGSRRTAPGAGPSGLREIRPAWSPDGSRLAYLAASDVTNGPDELRIMDTRTLESTSLGQVASYMSERRQRIDWYPEGNALLVVNKAPGDTRYHLYRLSLGDGSMTRLTPAFEEAVMASVGPIAKPDREGGDLATPPFVVGPATDPTTGHTYYAVYTARRISWVDANAEAADMRHEGSVGYLACIGSEAEGRFLLQEFPRTHHGFWLGGYAAKSFAPRAPYDWTWANGDRWDYTSWQDDARLDRVDWAAAAAMTWSLRARVPERAGVEDHHMWATQDPGHEEVGFIVEFDAPSVSSANAKPDPGS